MPRVIKHTAGKNGWSEWISPSLNTPYRMICCDCGLSHNVEFKMFKVARYQGNGYWKRGKRVTGAKILLRAQRNERSTAAIRRKKK